MQARSIFVPFGSTLLPRYLSSISSRVKTSCLPYYFLELRYTFFISSAFAISFNGIFWVFLINGFLVIFSSKFTRSIVGTCVKLCKLSFPITILPSNYIPESVSRFTRSHRSSGFCKMVSETGDMLSGKTETKLQMGFFAGCFRFLYADKWSYQDGNGMFGI